MWQRLVQVNRLTCWGGRSPTCEPHILFPLSFFFFLACSLLRWPQIPASPWPHPCPKRSRRHQPQGHRSPPYSPTPPPFFSLLLLSLLCICYVVGSVYIDQRYCARFPFPMRLGTVRPNCNRIRRVLLFPTIYAQEKTTSLIEKNTLRIQYYYSFIQESKHLLKFYKRHTHGHRGPVGFWISYYNNNISRRPLISRTFIVCLQFANILVYSSTLRGLFGHS